MQFKYPELFYALFLLVIPIIIHLFQLRKFEKTAFTNVKFLKKIELQTRKSAKLKKIVLLITRLLLFTFLIFAFTQPFSSKSKENKKQQTIVYLDNSLSMQAKQNNVSLLQNNIQSLLKNTNNTKNISVLTNNAYFENLTGKDLKNKLLSIKTTPKTLNLKQVLQQANSKFKSKNTGNLILISDFENLGNFKLDSTKNYFFVQTLPEKKANVSVDTVYVAQHETKKVILKVGLKNYGNAINNLTVSIYNKDILLGKSNVSLENNAYKEISFTVAFADNFNGKIVLEESFLPFDNTLFFSLNKPKKIQVLAIGENNSFLAKIYTKNEFNFRNNTLKQIDYNAILKQDLIVLNELDKIPNSLQKILYDFKKNGGSLVIIPSENIKINSYNSFFKLLRIGDITVKKEQKLNVTKIEFAHPILKTVFEKEINNFQYPKVNSFYETNLKQASSILKFENSTSFISQIATKKGKIYWLSAAINTNNSNFTNSPLIVPVFYNFGQQSYALKKLYYIIGKENVFDVAITLNKDEVLQMEAISDKTNNFIPLQQIQNLKTKIVTKENPLISDIYHIKNRTTVVEDIAYNYDRTESNIAYPDIKNSIVNKTNAIFSTTISNALTNVAEQNKTNTYWRFCMLMAILFLLLELSILKFWKK